MRSSLFIKIVIVAAIALGCGLRFYNLEQKFYWFDEAFTSLRISGHTEAELIAWLTQTRLVSVAELLQFFQLPNKPLWDTVHSLAVEEPQHPPLYFAIARLWMQGWINLGLPDWGFDAIGAIRSLSAVLSLLEIPLIGWLGRLLFRSVQVGWVAMALLAVSPFQRLYAQEAREYSLWTVTILLSSVLLLRAVRMQEPRVNWARVNWGLYAASLSLGLYTFPPTLLAMGSHGLYVAAIANFKLNRLTRSYLLASLMGLALFIPWLLILITNLDQVNQTFVRIEQASLPELLLGWAVNCCRLFLDYADYERQITYFGLVRPVEYVIYALWTIGFVGLTGYAFYFLNRHDKQSMPFVFSLAGVSSLPIVLINLCLGGRQSLVLRYLIPTTLAIVLAIAFLIASQMAASGSSASLSRKQVSWQAVLVLILMGGIISSTTSAQAQFWWTKSHSDMDYITAPAINQSDRPLLISDAPMGRILAFAHLLNPTVSLQLQPACFSCRDRGKPIQLRENLTQIDPSYKSVFLYNPSLPLLEHLQEQYRIVPIYLDPVHAEQKVVRLEKMY